MRDLRQSEGFTLLEVLVAINISAIIIALIITFYLFTAKFLNRSLNANEQKWNYTHFFYLLNRTLRNSNTLSMATNRKGLYLITSKKDSILFLPEFIGLNDLYKIDSIKEISLLIKTNNKILVDYENGKLITNETTSSMSNIIVFDELNITIRTGHFSYPFCYLSPPVSAFKFKDISENSF